MKVSSTVATDVDDDGRVTHGRLHFFDAARAIVMLLGIPLHAAALYNGVISLYRPVEYVGLLDGLYLIIHSFRMQAFFIIAGYFSLKTLKRHSLPNWLKNRASRLLLPFCTALVLIGPMLVALDAVNECGVLCDDPGDYVAYALDHVTAVTFVGHLWFLEYLIVLTMIFAAVSVLNNRIFLVQRTIFQAARGSRAVPPSVVLAMMVAYSVAISGIDNAAHVDSITVFWGSLNVQYFLNLVAFFSFGAYLAARPSHLQQFCHSSRVGAVLAVLAIATYVFCTGMATHESLVVKLGTVIGWVVAGVAGTQVLFAFCSRYFQSQSNLIRRIVDSSFTIYIVHYPLVILLGELLTLSGINVWVSFTLVIGIATMASYAIHRLIALQPVMLFLLNGVKIVKSEGSSNGRGAALPDVRSR